VGVSITEVHAACVARGSTAESKRDMGQGTSKGKTAIDGRRIMPFAVIVLALLLTQNSVPRDRTWRCGQVVSSERYTLLVGAGRCTLEGCCCIYDASRTLSHDAPPIRSMSS
jgi:hypothetical protein